MVTGRPPFLGDTPVAVASKHVREHPPTPREINPSVPPDLEAVILKCMAKSPEYRYTTGDELRADLLRFREGQAVVATAPARTFGSTQTLGATQALGAVGRTATVPQVSPLTFEEPEGPRSRTGIYAAVLVLLLVALAVVIVFLGQSLGWWHIGSKHHTPPTVATFSLPDVSGQSVTQAEATLQGKGLVTQTQQDTTSNQPITQVIRTNPTTGSNVHKGETITLITGGKAATTQITIPSNLINQSVTSASSELSALGLTPVPQYSSTCVNINEVCAVSPVQGSQVAKGSVVYLFQAEVTTTTVPPTTTTTVPPTTTTTFPTTTTSFPSSTTTTASGFLGPTNQGPGRHEQSRTPGNRDI